MDRSDGAAFVAAALFALASLAAAASPARAADRWELALGGGAFFSAAYPGSDERYVAPLPYARAVYATGKVEYSLSTLDGFMVQYLDLDRRLLFSLFGNVGDARDSEEYAPLFSGIEHDAATKRLLAGTPTARNPAYAAVLLGAVTPVGAVGGALYYQPTFWSGAEERFFNAFVPSAVYLAPIDITDSLKLTALVFLDFMDQEFADAWYSVEEATSALPAFSARAGLRDLQCILKVEYRIAKHLGAGLVARNVLFLADAADSPYTRSAYQLTAGLYLAYSL